MPLLPAAHVLWNGSDLELNARPPVTEAVRAVDLIDQELPARPPTIGFVFSHPSLRATEPAFREAVQRALAPLKSDPGVARIRTAWDTQPPDATRLSRDVGDGRAEGPGAGLRVDDVRRAAPRAL